FLNTAKTIICNNCGKVYPMDSLNNLKFYDMLCPSCKVGVCSVEDVEVSVPAEAPELLLTEIEFAALNSLRISEAQYATQLAQELDCTRQKISRVVDKLESKELVIRKKKDGEAGNRTYYYITDLAKRTYFC
ncbi:MarR family winged helix-turn-helix transcriptional regulator, partial [Salmonella enterica]|uniref:MarR family winged helix-turn-helix transcriptional regulator n=2 Tax=Bacteria TaxID=2 RepID=UPI003733FB14